MLLLDNRYTFCRLKNLQPFVTSQTAFGKKNESRKKRKVGKDRSFDFLSHPLRLSTGDNEGGDKPEDVEALIER